MTATAFSLSRESKLRNVLHKLQIDALPDSTPHKQQLLSIVSKYLDVFAESNLNVKTTNLTIQKIDTRFVLPLRQQVRR